jgi:hypothetical protein
VDEFADMNNRGTILCCIVTLAILLVPSEFSLAQETDEVPAANPGRPTVSSPATLTPVGYLQFENGGLYAAASPGLTAQFSFNQVTKLTVVPRLQFLSSWEPWARSSQSDGSAPNQPGGVALGVQAVAISGSGKKPTVSVSYFRSLYGGKTPNLDVGSAFQTGILLLSFDFGSLHVDTNGIVSEQTGDGIRRAQIGQTLSLSRGFGKYTLAGELWHFTQPFQNGNCVGNLWALSYTMHPNLAFDVGFNRGLTSSSTQWESFAGFTYLLPRRLWPARISHRRPG